MNIFVLDYNPQLAAKYHNDKHVVKMILESTQMLCTVHAKQGLDVPYKATHQNHPCVLWVEESLQNYFWLCDLLEALHEEWQYRYNHYYTHKSFDVYLNLDASNFRLQAKGLTPFAQCMPEQYRCDDAVEAYRAYYKAEKPGTYKAPAKAPEWLNV